MQVQDRAPARQPDPLLIAVIGATGRIGSAITAEARSRRHRVTRFDHSNVDVADPASVEVAIRGHDVVVVSVAGADQLAPRAVRALLEAMPWAKVDRLLFVGSGGSLEREPGLRFLDATDFPSADVQDALDQAEALRLLRAASTKVVWSYASPPPLHLVPGGRTGVYRVAAGDTPITDAFGRSRVTVGDYASAVVDAIEHGLFIRQRFTVAY